MVGHLNPSGKRYLFRLAVCLTLYAALLFPVDWAAHHGRMPAGFWLYLAAAAPALPVLGVIWAMLRYLSEEEDEYQRFHRVQGFIWATGLALAVMTVWGFLENFAAVRPLPAMYPFFIFMVCLGLVQGVSQWWRR
ncbi:MAG TPA: hypothetical protein VHE09_05920 [Rhizomicrobium sp.]|nr:hypothetical protein [Rhizomicrobium sp.]